MRGDRAALHTSFLRTWTAFLTRYCSRVVFDSTRTNHVSDALMLRTHSLSSIRHVVGFECHDVSFECCLQLCLFQLHLMIRNFFAFLLDITLVPCPAERDLTRDGPRGPFCAATKHVNLKGVRARCACSRHVASNMVGSASVDDRSGNPTKRAKQHSTF